MSATAQNRAVWRPIASVSVTAATVWVLASPQTASAAECEGVRLPDRVTVAGQPLMLNGLGVREATLFNVNVYVAGLYLEQRSSNPRQIVASNQHKQLILKFVRKVDREDMNDALEKGFENGGATAAMKPRIRQFASWMPNLKKGSILTFTYVPGRGVEVKVGRRVRGVIPGADFARLLFRIWLGPKPPNKGLKRGLLGGECG